MALTSTTDQLPSEVTVKFTAGMACHAEGITMFQPSVNDVQSAAPIFTSATCCGITVRGARGGRRKIDERQQTCTLLDSGISLTQDVIDSRSTHKAERQEHVDPSDDSYRRKERLVEE
jgi:hypothetical protein